MHLGKSLAGGLLLASIATSAQAWECVSFFGIVCAPPPACDHEPAPGSYIIQRVTQMTMPDGSYHDTDTECRFWGKVRGQSATPFSHYMACTFNNTLVGGKNVAVVLLPRPEQVGADAYQALWRHERGHVTCPE